jgi:uncharacterized protein (DUF488 family)
MSRFLRYAPSLSAITTILTIGHSTHEARGFLSLLGRVRIEAVADVRRYPSSRRMPWFNSGELGASLSAAGVEYRHLPELGGRRAGGLRGYADHMATPEFEAGLRELLELAGRRRTAMMCAEASWLRCHRRLISDALAARGHNVVHVWPGGRLEPHQARLEV